MFKSCLSSVSILARSDSRASSAKIKFENRRLIRGLLSSVTSVKSATPCQRSRKPACLNQIVSPLVIRESNQYENIASRTILQYGGLHTGRSKKPEVDVAGARAENPTKFTTSEANVNYRSTLNFYDDSSDHPPSHNFVIAFTCMAGIFYLIFLRDDVENDGGKNLFKPVHETIPHLAIPMLQTAIAEHKKLGMDASKLEKKLAECLKDPEKYGGNRPRKLVDN